MDAEEWVFEPETLSGEELVRFGQLLDKRPAELHGRTVVMELAEQLLYVRTRTGLTRSLCGPMRRSGRLNCGAGSGILF